MATFILVSGSWHGAWCWDHVVPLIEARRHRAIAVELAGMGDDRTPLRDVTLAGWAKQVANLVRAEPEPVVLVGHSRGGIIISEVAERVPDHIAGLVYLAAVLLPSGNSTARVSEMKADEEAGHQLADIYLPAEPGTAVLRPDVVRDMFFNTTPPDLADWAASKLGAEPLGPLGTPLQLTEKNFGRVRRDYIECLRDQAISIGVQRRFREVLPCRRVLTLDTDHSPFLSAPEELAAALDQLVRD